MPNRRLTPLLVAVLLILTACTTTRAPELAPTTTLVTIKVVGWEGDALMDLLIRAFQEQRPGYRVEKIPVPPRSSEGQILTLAKENLADILPLSLTGASTTSRAVIPLDPFLGRSGLDLAPFGSALEQLRTNGQLKELPFAFIPSVVVYNTQLVAAAGVTVPAESWTWEDLRVVARRLTRDGEVQGLVAPQPGYLVDTFVEGKTGQPPWDANTAVLDEALQFFETMTHTDRSLNTSAPGTFTSTMTSITSRSDVWDSFRQGQAAMMWLTMSPVELDSPPAPGFRWQMAPPPGFPGLVPVTTGSQRSLSILEYSSQPDAAWEFLRFAGGPEGAVVLAGAGYVPMYWNDAALRAFEQSRWAKYPGVGALWRSKWLVRSYDPSLSQQKHERDWAFKKAVNLTLSGTSSRAEAMAAFRQTVGEP